jgi:hypothetical protein
VTDGALTVPLSLSTLAAGVFSLRPWWRSPLNVALSPEGHQPGAGRAVLDAPPQGHPVSPGDGQTDADGQVHHQHPSPVRQVLGTYCVLGGQRSVQGPAKGDGQDRGTQDTVPFPSSGAFDSETCGRPRAFARLLAPSRGRGSAWDPRGPQAFFLSTSSPRLAASRGDSV